ncbi:hypothetical protein [Promicromonospora sp. MEB111]|uniref:hypothetical protein n=1 Tax=Promicromonospora sp. MEB111 TaxID=3040301 RepID=UPI002551C22B|nr:hypothetical protein [Promicromonospora sp. MEB111]
MRDGIRSGIAEVWDEVPENPEFHPHVSIAYSNADISTGPLRARVASLRDIEPVVVTHPDAHGVPMSLASAPLAQRTRLLGSGWPLETCGGSWSSATPTAS